MKVQELEMETFWFKPCILLFILHFYLFTFEALKDSYTESGIEIYSSYKARGEWYNG